MIGRLQEKLPAMLELAHQRSEAARIELAGMIADVFLSGDIQLTLREEEQVNELIDMLIHTRSPVVRMQLVQRFADVTQMPRKIAVSLTNEDLETAVPILSKCPNLADPDLVHIVETKGGDFARAVATRESISEAVADALVTTGDIEIMHIVAENLGAKLTPRAVEVMADTARFAAELREPLLKRPEATRETATRLYWWISQDLRRYALKQFGITSAQIDQALARTVDELLGYHRLDSADDKIMTQVADWLEDRQAVSAKILPQVLRLGHFRLFNILMSRLTKLDLTVIDNVLLGEGGRELAVLCRALGIDKPGFVSIFLLSRGARQDDHVVHPRELSQALQAFDHLTTNLAHDLLQSWCKNPAFLTRQPEEVVLEA